MRNLNSGQIALNQSTSGLWGSTYHIAKYLQDLITDRNVFLLNNTLFRPPIKIRSLSIKETSVDLFAFCDVVDMHMNPLQYVKKRTMYVYHL